AAEANGDDDLVAEGWLHLFDAAGAARGHFAEAAIYERHAEAALERLGSPARLRGHLSCREAHAAYVGANYDRAITKAQEGLEALTKVSEEARLESASCEVVLGETAQRQQKLEDARTHFGAALAAIEPLKGGTHPQVAALVWDLANVNSDL